MVKLTEFEGLDENTAQKLRQAGVSSANDLFEEGTTPEGRQKLATQTGIDLKLITSWVHQIDLQRIGGVGAGYASLLESAGVGTPRDLARRKPENLQRTLDRVNEEEELVGRLPSLSQVTEWVDQADLQRIKGVGEGYASLLESAGVETPLDLARRNPEDLHQVLERVNEEEELVRRRPSKKLVTGWVKQARGLGGDVGTDDIP